MLKPLILCDFDGTITEKDNVVAIMERFAPEEWKEIAFDLVKKQISIREGTDKLFKLIPSSYKKDIVTYLHETSPLRSGFREFSRLAKINNLPLYVVSGGMDFILQLKLKGLIPEENIFCNEADFTREFINVKWLHPCDARCEKDCGCCKPSILRKLMKQGKPQDIIVIGDSITDYEVAKVADHLYARDYLQQVCEREGIAYSAYEDFQDIINSFYQHTWFSK